MPTWLKRLAMRLRATLRRTDRDIRDEHLFHLALLEQEHRAAGLSPEEARQRAHREFGNVMRLQETSHDLFAFRFIEDLGADLRQAVRHMRRSKAFSWFPSSRWQLASLRLPRPLPSSTP